MATVRLPTARIVRALLQRSAEPPRDDGGEIKWAKGALNKCLLADFNVEVPVLVFRGELYLRVSLPLHVGRQEVSRLAAALSSLLAATNSSSPAAPVGTSKL